MLRRLVLRDYVIVDALDIEFAPGFSVLTGETGAGKSILIDALQLALGSRGDATAVREGASRADISAEFDAPESLTAWLFEAGFATEGEPQTRLLLRRVIDAQGRSRAWVNGSVATVQQLRDVASALVEIHGQHAWQSLTRAAAVREWLDSQAGVAPQALAAAWSQWRAAQKALEDATVGQAARAQERDRLAWQIAELDRLAPQPGEWDELDTEHRKLAHAQALVEASHAALQAVSDAEPSAEALVSQALSALDAVAEFDARLGPVCDTLRAAQAQLQDASHSLSAYLGHTEPEPDRLRQLDERMSAWMGLARRFRIPPDELPARLVQWRAELNQLDAASDLAALDQAVALAKKEYLVQARAVSAQRKRTAPILAKAVSEVLQRLGMAGGRFEILLEPLDEPQAYGLENVEFLVAGHAGSTPRPLAKVASGGELSRIALAVAVSSAAALGKATPTHSAPETLIFDEIDAGVGGAVASTVGALMRQLGQQYQVLAVTHLPQVAACGQNHWVVSKQKLGDRTTSGVEGVQGQARVIEIARMLGGDPPTAASLSHASEMLADGQAPTSKPAAKSAAKGH